MLTSGSVVRWNPSSSFDKAVEGNIGGLLLLLHRGNAIEFNHYKVMTWHCVNAWTKEINAYSCLQKRRWDGIILTPPTTSDLCPISIDCNKGGLLAMTRLQLQWNSNVGWKVAFEDFTNGPNCARSRYLEMKFHRWRDRHWSSIGTEKIKNKKSFWCWNIGHKCRILQPWRHCNGCKGKLQIGLPSMSLVSEFKPK